MNAGAPNVRAESQGPVRTLCINREAQRNALNRATLRELEAALHAAAADSAVRVIVLRGAGDRAFCAGADLREVTGHKNLKESRAHFGGVANVIRAMQSAPQPVVARVSGFALAGGCGLAAAADFTVAGEGAVFGLPEISLGLLPLMVAVPILRAVGSRKLLLDLALSGRRVPAAEARAIGLAGRVVPDADLDSEIKNLCARLASYSPQALRAGKEALYAAAEMEGAAALRYMREASILAARTEDAHEGIAAFFEKREPLWSGG